MEETLDLGAAQVQRLREEEAAGREDDSDDAKEGPQVRPPPLSHSSQHLRLLWQSRWGRGRLGRVRRQAAAGLAPVLLLELGPPPVPSKHPACEERAHQHADGAEHGGNCAGLLKLEMYIWRGRRCAREGSIKGSWRCTSGRSAGQGRRCRGEQESEVRPRVRGRGRGRGRGRRG